jgi:hypothetical protein
MKYSFLKGIIVLCAVLMSTAVGSVLACTSALVGKDATQNGRMLLWKHRDSGHPDNFVARVNGTVSEAGDSTYTFIGLFNADDSECREVWAGMNEVGLGIMNTASYNFAPDTAAVKDMEGVIMAEALKHCRTVTDFRALLDNKLATGNPLGVQANFGVIDANGNGVYIEAWDYGYTIFDLADETNNYMIRSNYSYAGGEDHRLGEVRHDNAVALLQPIAEVKDVTPTTFTESLSRSFLNTRFNKDLLTGNSRWIEDRGEMIPRHSSCASVVIEGGVAGNAPVMWISIGFPGFMPTEKVTFDYIPEGLLPTGANNHSPLCDEGVALRNKAMPRKNRSGKWLFDKNVIKTLVEK